MRILALLALAAGAAADPAWREILPRTCHAHATVTTATNLYRVGGHFAFRRYAIVRYPLVDGVPDGRAIEAAAFPDDLALLSPAAAVVADAIYVVGGQWQRRLEPGVQNTDVLRVPILADGSLGEVEKLGPFPVATTNGAGMLAVGNRLYVLGGYVKRSCHWTTVQPDGTLAPWQPTVRPLPTNLTCAGKVAEHHGVIYATGPPGHMMTSVKVFYCELGADGAPGKWRRVTNLPTRALAGALRADGDGLLYFDGETGRILRAGILTDPQIDVTDWQDVGAMPRPDLFGFSITRVPGGFVMLGALTNPKPHSYLPGMLLQLETP